VSDIATSSPFAPPRVSAVLLLSLSEEQAIKQLSGSIDVYTSKFKPMKYTVSGRDERTFMKLLVHADSDRVIGCHM
jgi:glutathione reductase (NADPH)